MCGIAGYAGTRQIDERTAARCLELLERRGPDDSGAMTFEIGNGRQVWLANRRLRIVDLESRARQPLAFDNCWVTYNGELYNHRELRQDLEREGARFRTTSDTEVLVAAIARRGWSVLDECEGMWAFALFDATSGSLHLCRDRFGEKPLYVYRDDTGVYFASEVKCLRALVGRAFDIDGDHLRRYLVNGYKSLYKTTSTFFQGVSELAPASRLCISRDGDEQIDRYWTARVCPDEAIGYQDAVDGVRRRVERSVELRLRADVPLAFCLSGGVDSNVLASVAHRVFGYDVHGFTVIDRDPRYDESALARASARTLGIRHTEVEVRTGGFLDDLRTLVRYHDAPVATISYFVQWQLMKAIAAAGYRVSVSGTGADELFTGYYDHHLLYLQDIAADAVALAAARTAWETYVRPLVRNPALMDADRFVADPEFRDHIFLNVDTFAAMMVDPWREPFSERALTSAGLLRNRMLNELLHEVVPVILHEDDLNAMYYSIENRSPFLDRGLADFCGRIPTRHLIRNGFAKAILRDAFRGVLPPAIVENRTKVGFNASILSMLDTRSPGVRDAVLAESPVFDYVRRDAIRQLLDRPQLPNSEGKFLFQFLNAKMFVEEFGAAA